MPSPTRAFLRATEGATMPEYAIMVSLICAVCVVIVSSLGIKVRDLFTRVGIF